MPKTAGKTLVGRMWFFRLQLQEDASGLNILDR